MLVNDDPPRWGFHSTRIVASPIPSQNRHGPESDGDDGPDVGRNIFQLTSYSRDHYRPRVNASSGLWWDLHIEMYGTFNLLG